MLLHRGDVESARKLIEETLRDCFSSLKLSQILSHPGNLISFRLSAILFILFLNQAELRLLASKLRQRECEWVNHQSVRGTSKTELSQAGPIDLVLDAWKLAATASKWAETDLRTPASQELSLLWISPRLGDLQLRCVDQISVLFRAIGAPRELKCHLKWGLRLAQTLCLPLRAAHFLLKLSDCYLLCDDEVATEALLQGVDHILGGKFGKAKPGEKDNCSSQGAEEVVRLPGQSELQALTASPSLVKSVVTKPEFLSHPSTCSCFSCKTAPLHVILMKLALYRAAARDMAGDGGSAMTMVNLAMEMVPSLMAKTRRVNPRDLEHVRVELVEGLQGRLESLGCRHAWQECRQVVALVRRELEALPLTKIKALPELVLRTVEQERFLDAAERREAELEEERKEKESLTLATSSFSKMQLDIEQSSTPEASSRTVSRVMGGAPSKRIMPSMGVSLNF